MGGNEQLAAIRNGLVKLHKTLLDSERSLYERDIGRIHSVGHFFELVLHDPWFAWLHELSEFIVLIDERLEDEEPLSREDAGWLTAKARALLLPQEEGRGFARRYYEAIQRDPDVVLAHGSVMKVLNGGG